MKLVVFGLSITSSWGNGHATLWRGLCRALAARGHTITFFEHDLPYYAAHRDAAVLPGVDVQLHDGWDAALPRVAAALDEADVGIVTSYCPDGVAAARLLLGSLSGVRVFYDLDTPITLESVKAGTPVAYVPPEGLSGFDLVLSYTGGAALGELERVLGAKRVAPLYGSVDPAVHFPAPAREDYAADLSYLGTYAADRQPSLESLFLGPARAHPGKRFLIGGSQYPDDFPWASNVAHVAHVAPRDHPAFFGSSPLALSVTKKAMAASGFCPSGRLFEAAACGTAVLTDWWPGLEHFFEPGSEVLVCRGADDAMAALALSPGHLERVALAARARVLEEHTASARAAELERLISEV